MKVPAAIPDALHDEVQRTVEEILGDVRDRGFDAVRDWSLKLDHAEPLRVPPEEAERAAAELPRPLREALLRSIRNVRAFHHRQGQLLEDLEMETEPGALCGLRFLPVEAAAVYVPGGRYPLPSTAIMGVVPAQEAGVKRIVVCTPPGRGGAIHPVVLGTLELLGVREIWRMGGAQGLAALALGAKPADPVDLIVGPGNAYVTEAKRQLFGAVGLDGLAGPSEVLILADGDADPRVLATDLLAQSEHDPMARGILLCEDASVAEATLAAVEEILSSLPTAGVARIAWEANGGVAVCPMHEAVAFANALAPEHLELAVRSPRAILEACTAYGAAFLGGESAEVFGDYIAGTNHTLPTGGKARFSGGLWTGTFLRPLTHLSLTREAAASLATGGAVIADAEGLAAHAAALRARETEEPVGPGGRESGGIAFPPL